MADFAFDTYRAVKNLQTAGFDASQAEAVVDAIGAANGAWADYATKDDFDAQGRANKEDLAGVQSTLGTRIDEVESTLGARIDGVEARIDEVEKSLKKDIENVEKSLRKDIENVEKSLGSRIEAVDKSLNTRINDVAKYLEQSMKNFQLRTMLWGTTVVVGLAAWITFLDRIRAFLGLG